MPVVAHTTPGRMIFCALKNMESCEKAILGGGNYYHHLRYYYYY